MYFKGIKHREILVLQLTAMVDIFALLVIFLIKGSVFGVTDLVFPPEINIPDSVSKESLESGPTIIVGQGKVTVTFLNENVPLDVFRYNKADTTERKKIERKISDFVKKLPAEATKSGVLLNLVADREVIYRDVFDVIKVFRASGFQGILFIAKGT